MSFFSVAEYYYIGFGSIFFPCFKTYKKITLASFKNLKPLETSFTLRQ